MLTHGHQEGVRILVSPLVLHSTYLLQFSTWTLGTECSVTHVTKTVAVTVTWIETLSDLSPL